MAVQDKYVNADVAADKLGNAALVNGARVIAMVATEELAAGDSAASVYRFFKGVSGNLIPMDIKVYYDDAITDEVDADVGLYEQGVGGAVIDADVFKAGLDFTTAGGSVRGGGVIGHEEATDGMGSVDIANLTKKIYEHAGHTVNTAKDGYDICLTCNTGVTTTGGTVTMIATFIEG
jgi:hypothetical protein